MKIKEVIKEIAFTPANFIKEGKIDSKIECVKSSFKSERDPKILVELCRAIFERNHYISRSYTDSNDRREEFQTLVHYHSQVDASRLLFLFEEILRKDLEYISDVDWKDGLNQVNSLKDNHWGFGIIDGETEVRIVHGGTLRFLKEFAEGDCFGYRLERGGVGIQVHPVIAEPKIGCFKNENAALRRSEFYAERMLRFSFDTPAILTGRVKVKYLIPGNNEYEAAIAQKDFKYIENLKVDSFLRIKSKL